MNAHDRLLRGDFSHCQFCGAKEYDSEGPCPCSNEWQCMNPECGEHDDYRFGVSDKEVSLSVHCLNCFEEYEAVLYKPLEDYNEPFAVD